MSQEFTTDAFIAHVESLLEAIPDGGRQVIAIAGAPASGKSTIASRLNERLNEVAPGSTALLPMDGYHFDDEMLVPRGWRPRKGAPHTFDVGGYASALRRIRANDEPFVAVPRFDRDLEIARAGAIIIEPTVRLIVSEGNWLLLQDEPWPTLLPLFDHTALVKTEWETLEQRNRDRWVGYDYTEEMILEKLEGNDLPNARLVYERSTEPDWIIRT
ncbi:MAG: nucleoside/nucleotide kinase family protein [Candidatus Limnocylindrales bacterium]